MTDESEDSYVDENGRQVSKDSFGSGADNVKYDQFMEGYYDYKERMINPATENMKMGKDSKDFINKIFKLINRDMQLGNMDPKTYTIIYDHMHLGSELMRFGLFTAGKIFIQKGYLLAVMSNSKGGFLRKMENTTTSRRVSVAEQPGSAGGSSGWLRFIPGKKKQQ